MCKPQRVPASMLCKFMLESTMVDAVLAVAEAVRRNRFTTIIKILFVTSKVSDVNTSHCWWLSSCLVLLTLSMVVQCCNSHNWNVKIRLAEKATSFVKILLWFCLSNSWKQDLKATHLEMTILNAFYSYSWFSTIYGTIYKQRQSDRDFKHIRGNLKKYRA